MPALLSEFPLEDRPLAGRSSFIFLSRSTTNETV